MTKEELINSTLAVYDEYHPQQSVDEDLKLLLEEFLSKHINDFVCILPTNAINDSLIVFLNKGQLTIQPINYKGGSVTLPENFLKLISFKHADWKIKLFNADLIQENDARRKLQEDKFTSGKTAKPCICIEHVQGKKCLNFWGYKNNVEDVAEFSYIKKTDDLDTFANNTEDYILQAYIYYVLYFVMNTTQDIQLAQVSLQQMQQLLSLHNIIPLLPVQFHNTKK